MPLYKIITLEYDHWLIVMHFPNHSWMDICARTSCERQPGYLCSPTRQNHSSMVPIYCASWSGLSCAFSSCIFSSSAVVEALRLWDDAEALRSMLFDSELLLLRLWKSFSRLIASSSISTKVLGGSPFGLVMDLIRSRMESNLACCSGLRWFVLLGPPALRNAATERAEFSAGKGCLLGDMVAFMDLFSVCSIYIATVVGILSPFLCLLISRLFLRSFSYRKKGDLYVVYCCQLSWASYVHGLFIDEWAVARTHKNVERDFSMGASQT